MFFARVFIAERAEAISDQDVLLIVEGCVTNLDTVRTVELDESVGGVRLTSPDVIAVNPVSVGPTFVLHLPEPSCFFRHSVSL